MAGGESYLDHDMAHRVTELEVRTAYQEKLLTELDGVVHDFCRRIEQLEGQLADLREGSKGQEIGPGNEKPPHY